MTKRYNLTLEKVEKILKTTKTKRFEDTPVEVCVLIQLLCRDIIIARTK